MKHPDYNPDATTSPLDEELIQCAVECAQNIAANRAGFAVHPCANVSHQWKTTFSKRAEALLETIASRPAATVDGLIAKARLVPSLFYPDEPDEFELHPETSILFFKTFAADCDRLVKPTEGVQS